MFFSSQAPTKIGGRYYTIKPFVPIHIVHRTHTAERFCCWEIFFALFRCCCFFFGNLTNDFFSVFLCFSSHSRYQMRKKEIESCNDNGTTMTTTSNNTNPILTNSTTTQTTQTTTCGYTNTLTMVSVCGQMNSQPHRIDPLPTERIRVFIRIDQISHKLQLFCSDFYCAPFGFRLMLVAGVRQRTTDLSSGKKI